MRDVLVCLDANDGQEVWRIDFVKQFESALPSFGFVCSPLVVGEHLFVQAGACLAKLDKHTGEVLWRSLEDRGGMNGSVFSSPALGVLNGAAQLLVQTRTTLAGVDVESGAVLWSQEIPAFRGMNILTPTTYNDGVFTSSYGGKSLMFGFEDGETVERWQNKAQGYMSTPIIIDGHAYLHLRNQRFTCIDLDTGETKWKSKPYGKYCSLVANGNQILALDQRGILLLIEASPEEFRLISEKQLSDEETWAHLGVVGNQLFVRELEAMSVYRWNGAATAISGR
jgi:outer membrane protein assembly factor BamB